ncbi:hypothetical protein HDV06_001941 [Boothiomyces sp. JEL0866]|nr:hypothetical protein HDV06_001941 [Boothiomyces sp. JEL0866]
MDQLEAMLSSPWKKEEDKKRKLEVHSSSDTDFSTEKCVGSPLSEGGTVFDPDEFVQNFALDMDAIYYENNSLVIAEQQKFKSLDLLKLVKHLVDSSYLYYCGFSCDDDLQSTPPYRREQISNNLKNALCFHSVFYSTSENLFPHKQPTKHERLIASKRFEISANSYKRFDNQLLCDDVRALLLHANSQFNLGNLDVSKKMFVEAYSTGKRNGLFNTKDFSLETSEKMLTIDELNSRIADLTVAKVGKTTAVEAAERLALLAYCLRVDTLLAIGNGDGFVFDESEFPHLPDVPVKPARKEQKHKSVIHDLATNTLWEKTKWAPMCDEIRQTSLAICDWLPEANQRATAEIYLWRNIRKVIRFVRSCKLNKPCKPYDDKRRLQLGNSILQQIDETPSGFAPFHSLAEFTQDKQPFFPRIRNAMEIHNMYLALIVSLCYLHLAGLQSDDSLLFPIEHNGEAKYTSRDILFLCMKALCHIIQMTQSPSHPQDSVFQPKYNQMELASALMYPGIPQTPTPHLADGFTAMLIYSISSSCLISYSIGGNTDERAHVVNMIKSVVLPCLTRICSVWSVAEKYQIQLHNLVVKFEPSKF